MAQFSTARVEDVIPQRKQRQPSQRAQTQRQYQEALRSALVDRDQALVVTLAPDDKALTIRNRIRRAADALGMENVLIRRRRDRIIAYSAPAVDEGQ